MPGANRFSYTITTEKFLEIVPFTSKLGVAKTAAPKIKIAFGIEIDKEKKIILPTALRILMQTVSCRKIDGLMTVHPSHLHLKRSHLVTVVAMLFQPHLRLQR